jgi:hypothetical protein
MTKDTKNPAAEKALPRVEEFLAAVESKTADEAHRRLLRACRKENPTAAMEAELKLIVEEIINET